MSTTLALDFVSPLPPARSGIADYSADLLPHLAPLCDLTVITLPGQQLPAGLNVNVATLEDFDPDPVEPRLRLYQIGNNRHHIDIWRHALALPGVVTLHDLNLHHLVVEATLGQGDFDAYRSHLERDHGWLGDTVARARRWHDLAQPAMFNLAVNRTLLRRQRGVLVHSHWARDILLREDPDLAVRVVPMGVPLTDQVDHATAQRWRQQCGIPKGVPLLGSFGFQTPIKRTHRAIAALARPELASAHLLVGGEVSPRIDLEEVARDAGVADRVHFLGFLAFDELEAAIAACDLCLNLRYPTAGETSASLLRLLAVGRPTVVSDYAQFSELPDAVALKVPLGTGDGELEQLAADTGALLQDRDRLQAMAVAARDLIARKHAPAAAARGVVEACHQLAQLEPPGDAPARPLLPSSLLWRKLDGQLSIAGADDPWPKGAARRLDIRLENLSLARWLSAEHTTGGVMIDIHWRSDHSEPPAEQTWLPLPHDLEPGDSIDLAVEVRRPPHRSRQLVIEPHLRDISGFNKVGGPSRLLEFA